MRSSCDRCGHVGTLLAFAPETPPIADARAAALVAEDWRAFASRYVCPGCGGRARWAHGDLAVIREPAEDEWARRHGTMVVVLRWVDEETVAVCSAYRPREAAGHYRHDELEAR